MGDIFIIRRPEVETIVWNDLKRCDDVVWAAYLDHAAGRVSCPHSQFLKFPWNPRQRIISLPAAFEGRGAAIGVKWIASFPQNVARGLQRASAVIILNDGRTGFPIACVEASLISLVRTVLLAIRAVDVIRRPDYKGQTLGIVGAGAIARTMCRCLRIYGERVNTIRVFDTDRKRAQEFAHDDDGHFSSAESVVVDHDIGTTIRHSTIVLFATTAPSPHVSDLTLFDHRPLVLHLSLRDLDPRVICVADNVVDDVMSKQIVSR